MAAEEQRGFAAAVVVAASEGAAVGETTLLAVVAAAVGPAAVEARTVVAGEGIQLVQLPAQPEPVAGMD